jgi:hypothetical protein
MRKLLVLAMVLGLSTASWGGVISLSAVTDAVTPLNVNDTFTIVFYAEDYSGTTGGLVGADTRIQYDPLVLDVLDIDSDGTAMYNNIKNPQTLVTVPAPNHGAEWQFDIPGNTGGMKDDGVGEITKVGGSVLTFFGGLVVGVQGDPVILGAVEFKMIALPAAGTSTTLTLLGHPTSPGDTFGRGDGGGGDDGLNLPLDVELEVPEPTTLLVLGSGLVGLLGVRRRKAL